MNQGQQEWISRSNSVFMNTYGRFPAVIEQGKGATLIDVAGRSYLDFVSGIAVCSLGHCHPKVTEAICQQAGKLVHVSNLFHTIPQTKLAELLVKHSFADRVFFANSGAEANEGAIKLARKYGGDGRYEVISLEGSFHGRTLATVAATGQPKFSIGFEPMPKGFCSVPFGDIEALARTISDKTCAILCEPLQGEGGVRPLRPEYLQSIRELCDEHNLLLIFDEVQVGIGRTGTLFAYEQLGAVPDIMTIAKALGNGMPISAILTTNTIADSFSPGTHATTFGGNPVCSAAALAVMEVMLENGFLQKVVDKGTYLKVRLENLCTSFPEFAEGVRGEGLIQGLVLTEKGADNGVKIVNHLFERGILINFAANKVLRFIPPLIIKEKEIDLMINGLSKVLTQIS